MQRFPARITSPEGAFIVRLSEAADTVPQVCTRLSAVIMPDYFVGEECPLAHVERGPFRAHRRLNFSAL